MKLSVTAEWINFRDAVLPKNASDIQKSEMKIAFYAGFFCMLTLARDVLGSPEMSEDDGVIVLESLWRECHAFKESLIA